MIGYAISKNKVKIRLTEERWFHIIESHDHMSGLSDVTKEDGFVITAFLTSEVDRVRKDRKILWKKN